MLYNECMKLNCYNEAEKLTREMVSINSINSKEKRESAMACFVYDWLKDLPGLSDHSENLLLFPTKRDNCRRESVIGFLDNGYKDTVILMGHIDTVDIEDYGALKECAFDCDQLAKRLPEVFDLSEEVLKDLKSGDYLFGRGALDMKSGVAAILLVFSYFCHHPEQIHGNLLLLCECDEEGSSLGVISALDMLEKWKAEKGLVYKACINTDFHTAFDEAENKRTVHLGTVGKLLPCFAAFGKEAHAGKPFDAFDPNLLQAEIVRRMSYNPFFSDSDQNAKSVVPISLKLSDSKSSYTVQTALSSFSYFNVMIYDSTPKEIMDKCVKTAEEAFEETIRLINSRYESYQDREGKLPWKKRVYTYCDWMEYLRKNNSRFEQEYETWCHDLAKTHKDMDIRDFAFRMVSKSVEYDPLKEPVLILFFGTMYYSPVKCEDERLTQSVHKAIKTVGAQSNYDIECAYYYPYISDMSFFALNTDEKGIEDLLANSPQAYLFYDYPAEKIRSLQLPVVNIGVYGKDGHAFTERVEKTYSFHEVPNLILETLLDYLS